MLSCEKAAHIGKLLNLNDFIAKIVLLSDFEVDLFANLISHLCHKLLETAPSVERNAKHAG
jgi:hypothetical protein